MKTNRLITIFLFCFVASAIYSENLKHELRATWFTTHYAIDWPKTKATSDANREKQKNEMTDIFYTIFSLKFRIYYIIKLFVYGYYNEQKVIK